MQLMVTTQQSVEMDPDDPLRDYMLRVRSNSQLRLIIGLVLIYYIQAYARICKVLGTDFVPYMQYVMPPLMTSAGIKPTLKILPFNVRKQTWRVYSNINTWYIDDY